MNVFDSRVLLLENRDLAPIHKSDNKLKKTLTPIQKRPQRKTPGKIATPIIERLIIYLKLLIIYLLMICTACNRGPSGAPQTYQATGQIVSIAPDRSTVTIQHEDIKGFMPAMTMSFPVKNPALLTGLETNDLVRFELTVTPEDSWVSRIEKTGHSNNTADSSNGNVSTQIGSGLAPGQVVPPFSLKDQEGRTVTPMDFRGKPVAITFIFTRCPLPDYCPRFTSNFAAVQRQLGPRFKDRFHLLSISIDPTNDRPPVLKEYGRRSGADFHTWSFLTGSAEEIKKVAGHYGVGIWNQQGSITHSAACAIVSPSGTLYKLYHDNTWTPEQIISDMTTLLTEPDHGIKS